MGGSIFVRSQSKLECFLKQTAAPGPWSRLYYQLINRLILDDTEVLVGIKAEIGEPLPGHPTKGFIEVAVDVCGISHSSNSLLSEEIPHQMD